jgi:hypothetical protein
MKPKVIIPKSVCVCVCVCVCEIRPLEGALVCEGPSHIRLMEVGRLP